MRCPFSVKFRMLVAEVDPRSRMHNPSADSHERDNSARPLDRRVSFCMACAGRVSGPDAPRKSFMKFWETDDTRTSLLLFIPMLRRIRLPAMGPHLVVYYSNRVSPLAPTYGRCAGYRPCP